MGSSAINLSVFILPSSELEDLTLDARSRSVKAAAKRWPDRIRDALKSTEASSQA